METARSSSGGYVAPSTDDTKKAASYKAALEKADKTYTNTTGKKGTKYYYKARVMVYDAQGELVTRSELKQCKYACRTK